MEGHFQHSFNEGSSRQLSTEGSLDRSQSDFAGLGQCSPVLMPGAGQTVFQVSREASFDYVHSCVWDSRQNCMPRPREGFVNS